MKLDWKALAGLLVYLVTGIAGSLLLKHGMSGMPAVRNFSGGELWEMMRHVFTTPSVGLGVALLAAQFSILLAVLSAVDLSIVGPARAGEYVALTALAHFVLHEPVPLIRWIGVLLITGGVALLLSSRHEPAGGREQPMGDTLLETETVAEPG